jgi:hypothetical protein
MLRQGDPRLERRPVNGGLDAAAQQLNEARIRGYMQSLQQYRDFFAAAEHTGAAREHALVVSADLLRWGDRGRGVTAGAGRGGPCWPLSQRLVGPLSQRLVRRASTGGRWAFWTRCRGRTASAATCSRRCCVRGRPSERARLLPRTRRRRRRLLWHGCPCGTR